MPTMMLSPGREGRFRRRGDDQLAPREPLADVVVGVAAHPERDPAGQERPEALPGAAVKLHVDRVLAEPRLAVLGRDEIGEQRADRAVAVADRQRALDPLLVLDRVLADPEQLPVELLGEDVGLALDAADRRAVGHLRHPQEGSQVEMLRLPVLLEDRRREQVRPPDDLVERTEAHRAEDLANLLGDEEEVVDHLLGRAGELGAEDRVLGGDADRAGVQVALAHHQAAHRDQRARWRSRIPRRPGRRRR